MAAMAARRMSARRINSNENVKMVEENVASSMK
jgi:hypothetical protein